MKRFLKFRYGQGGFTLIELLIVVAILGILAAVIIPNVAGFMTTGTLNAANTELENVRTAGMAYYAENSKWPEWASIQLAGDFITGEIKADYQWNVNGEIRGNLDVCPSVPNPWTGIKWDPPDTFGGHWVRD